MERANNNLGYNCNSLAKYKNYEWSGVQLERILDLFSIEFGMEWGSEIKDAAKKDLERI